MELHIIPQYAFFIGILFQSALQIKDTDGIWVMLASMLIACIAFYERSNDKHLIEITPDRLIFYGVIYLFIFTFFYKDRILNRISELQLFVFSIIFSFSIFTLWKEFTPIEIGIKIFGVFCVLFFLFLCTTKFTLPNPLKFFMYLFYLIMNVILLVLIFSVKDIAQLFNQQNIQTLSAFLNGTIVFILGSRIVNILLIAPLPTKLQHMRESFEIAREHRSLLASKIIDEKVAYNPMRLLLISLLSVLGLSVGGIFIEPILLIQFLLIFSTYFFSYKNKGIINK